MTIMNRRNAALSLALVALAAPLAACGGGGSDKPSYCKDKDALQQSIKGISSVNVVQNGVSALQDQLKQVRSDAKALVSSAKDAFPDQTKALNTAVDTLDARIRALASSPTPQQLGSLAVDAANVVRATEAFATAAKDKC